MSKTLRLMLVIAAIILLWISALFGQEAKAPTLDKAQKQAIVDEIATLLNKNYIFAETAKKIEEALRAKLAAGDFDSANEAPAFAQAVSRLLLDVGKDRHMGFAYNPAMAEDLRRLMGRSEEEVEEGPRAAARGVQAGQLRLPQGREAPGEHRLPRLPRLPNRRPTPARRPSRP